MVAVLVRGLTATHSSPFLPQRWPKLLPLIHGGMARLSRKFCLVVNKDEGYLFVDYCQYSLGLNAA